jgi:hypothetical protein
MVVRSVGLARHDIKPTLRALKHPFEAWWLAYGGNLLNEASRSILGECHIWTSLFLTPNASVGGWRPTTPA